MKITICSNELNFIPWRPELGQVFRSPYGFDSETAAIDEQHPWLTPAFVLGAAFDGSQGYFIRREHASAFFAAHRDIPLAMHNAPFDLAVLDTLAPELRIYDWVDQDLIWDTRLLHRGYKLATEGNTASGKGESTLDRCAELYLQLDLPKDVKDSRGNDVRLSYGQWLNRPPQEIETVYLEYLAKDAVVTFLLFQELRSRLKEALEASDDAFGYVTPEWLAEQVRRWGWQTHHIQLKASIVLERVAANGMCVDLARRDELIPILEAVSQENLQVLRQHGYMPGETGSSKALQEILARLEVSHPDLSFPRTATDQYGTSRQAIAEMVGTEPFIDSLLKYKEVEKLQAAFLDKMGRNVIHASFDVLKTTGRTSSFGEINAQNLPRDDRIRSCFVPSAGNVFIAADYKTVELATLGQVVISQFDTPSVMAEQINQGRDLHRLMASRVANKPEAEVTPDERQKAKAINFGKPGGMGDEGLRRYAKTSYGVDLTLEEVRLLSGAWSSTFPEMWKFLSREEDSLALDVAWFFDLTPMGYFEHTGMRSFLDHPNNQGYENEPHSVLGAMCLKVVRAEAPCKGSGIPYSSEELDYFWSQVNKRLEDLPSKDRHTARQRRPCAKLQRALMRLVDRGKVITSTGRLRANASFCARHNTLFQGLAADGAKLALWKLWRAGFRLVNFLHDEVIVEVRQDSNLKAQAEEISRLMIEGMREVVPDVRIEVEYAAASRWYKSAKAVYDQEGNLLLWTPKEIKPRPEPPVSVLPSEPVEPARQACNLGETCITAA